MLIILYQNSSCIILSRSHEINFLHPVFKITSVSADQNSLTCQVDCSGVNAASLSCIGWILVGSDSHSSNLGLKCLRQCVFPLHTEFEALLWVMCSLASLSIFYIAFDTYYKELEDFNVLKLRFLHLLSFISCLNNICDDCFAKKL